MCNMAIHIWAKPWAHISCSLSNALLAHIQTALPSAGPLWCGAPVQLHSLRCFWREPGLSCNQNSSISLTSYQCDHMYTHCASKIWIWNLKLRGFTIPTGLTCMHLWQQSPTTHTSLPKFVPVCPFCQLCLLPTKFKAMRCHAPSLIHFLWVSEQATGSCGRLHRGNCDQRVSSFLPGLNFNRSRRLKLES